MTIKVELDDQDYILRVEIDENIYHFSVLNQKVIEIIELIRNLITGKED